MKELISLFLLELMQEQRTGYRKLLIVVICSANLGTQNFIMNYQMLMMMKSAQFCRADWTFLEAPESIDEMRLYCESVDGPKLANMLEFGKTPLLSAQELLSLGYTVAAYPLTLLSASTKAMQDALLALRESGIAPVNQILPFSDLQRVVGFNEYYKDLERY